MPQLTGLAMPELAIAHSCTLAGCGILLALALWRLERIHGLQNLRLWMCYSLLLTVQHLAGGAWVCAQPDPDPSSLTRSLLATAALASHYLKLGCMLLGAAELRRGRPIESRYRIATVAASALVAVTVVLTTMLASQDVRRLARVDMPLLVEMAATLTAGVVLLHRAAPGHGIGRTTVGLGFVAAAVASAASSPLLLDLVGQRDPDQALLVGMLVLTLAHFGLGLGVLIWALESERRAAAERAATASEGTRRLMAAQKMEAIGRLAGGVAHDFNNVLAAMFAINDQLMAMPGLPPAAIDALQELRQAARQANKMTKQLRELASNKTGPRRIFDLNRVVENMSPMLRRLVGQRLELEVTLPAMRSPVRLHQGQAEQVLLNLVINSRDAIHEHGAIGIRVGSDTTRSPHRVTLTVTDDGAGMSDEVQLRVLEPFFTTKGDRGTGLGLSVIYAITQQSDGDIDIKSAPGMGTSITVSWPTAPGAIHESDISSYDAPLQQNRTVLLAEDDRTVLEITSRTLEHAGYRVLAAGTTEDALRIADEHGSTIDVLLTDVMMPGMSGPELAAKIRLRRPEITVLFVSGYVDDEIKAKMQDEAALLDKPFTRRQLLRFLEEHLRPKA